MITLQIIELCYVKANKNSILFYDYDNRINRKLLVSDCDRSWNYTETVRTLMPSNRTKQNINYRTTFISLKDNLILYQTNKRTYLGPIETINSLDLKQDMEIPALPSNKIFTVDWLDRNIYFFNLPYLYIIDLLGKYDEQIILEIHNRTENIRNLIVEMTFHFLAWIHDDKTIFKCNKIGGDLKQYRHPRGRILSFVNDPFKQRLIIIISHSSKLRINYLDYDLNRLKQVISINLPSNYSLYHEDHVISSSILCSNNLIFMLSTRDNMNYAGKVRLYDDNFNDLKRFPSKIEYNTEKEMFLINSMIYNLLDPCLDCEEFGTHLNRTKCFCFCEYENCKRVKEFGFWGYLFCLLSIILILLMIYAITYQLPIKQSTIINQVSRRSSLLQSIMSTEEYYTTTDTKSHRTVVLKKTKSKQINRNPQRRKNSSSIITSLLSPTTCKRLKKEASLKYSRKAKALKFIRHDQKIRLPKHKIVRYVSLVPIERRSQLFETSRTSKFYEVATKSEKRRKKFFFNCDYNAEADPSFGDVAKNSQLRAWINHKYPTVERTSKYKNEKINEIEKSVKVWDIFDDFRTDELYEVEKFEGKSFKKSDDVIILQNLRYNDRRENITGNTRRINKKFSINQSSIFRSFDRGSKKFEFFHK